MKRFLSLLLAFTFLFTMLVACGNQTPAGNEGNTTEAPVVEEPPLVIAENGESKFRIIYDRLEMLDIPTLEPKLDALIDKIEDNTGAKIARASTNANTYNKDSYEILIGNTGYEESIAATKDLRLKDYNIVRNGNKIVIVGGNSETLITAITWFINKVAGGEEAKTGKITFTPELEREYRFKYKAESFVAAGQELKDFTLVYPADYRAAEHEVAYILCDYFQQYYGYTLPVKSDRDTYEKEILIGNTARTTITAGKEEYRVEVAENKVQIVAGSTAVYEYIPTQFYEQYIPLGEVSSVTKNMTTLLQERKDSMLSTTGDIRVIFHNVYGGTNPDANTYTNPILRWNLISNLYEEYMADVLCLQEFNNVPRNGMTTGLDSRLKAMGYAEVPTNQYAVNVTYKNGDKNQGITNWSITTTNGNQTPHTPIFYNPEKLELLEYGDYIYSSRITDEEISQLYSVYKHKLGTRYENPKDPSSASQLLWDYERFNDNIRYGGLSKTTVWAIFKDKATGKVFAVASVHLDHQDTCYSNLRRARQAEELLNEISTKILVGEYANIPMIFGGDINTSYNRENGKYKNTGAINNFEAAGYKDVQTTMTGADQMNSYGGYANFDKDKNYFTKIGGGSGSAKESIDHCFYKGAITPTSFDVMDHGYARRTSDHLPLVVDFKLQ